MPDETGKLLKKATSLAKKGDTASARFARGLAQVLKDLERQLPDLLAGAPDRSALLRAARVGQLRQQLRDALTVAGYPQLVTEQTTSPLNELVKRAMQDRIAQEAARFSPVFGAQLDALRALQSLDLLVEGDSLIQDLWQATARGLFSSRDPRQIVADLQDILDYTEPQIQTLYDTNVSIFMRQVEALQADPSADTKFLYAGPVDSKTRDWCLQRVGKVFTRAEIEDMDNGQLDNPFLTGGGYNCRHTWQEVSKFSELQHLSGRVPEVQQQLDELKNAA